MFFFFFDSPSLVDRIKFFLPDGWEVVGHMRQENWWNKGYHYRVFIRNGRIYHHISLEIDDVSKDRQYRYFVEASDFVPYWLKPMRGEEWTWCSEEHRLATMRVAEQNEKKRKADGYLLNVHHFDRIADRIRRMR